MSVCIIIPARKGSTRLPNKPMLKINDKEMILHVYENCLKSKITKDIFVATDSEEIKELIEKHNGKAIITDSELISGTDRVYQAYKKENLKHEYIINVQGDMPNISSELITKTYEAILKSNFDITTPVIKTNKDDVNLNKSQFVKAVISKAENELASQAIYFTRSKCPHESEDFFIHIGLYTYAKNSLEKFISLKPSYLEKIEKLEQLRAIENGMKIGVIQTEKAPISIDTQEDLDIANESKLI